MGLSHGTGNRLLEFTGRECVHCLRTEPVVKEVERELDRPIEQFEVWYDAGNAALMARYGDAIRGACGGVLGVPAFYNERTGEALCGEQDVDTLRTWATASSRQRM